MASGHVNRTNRPNTWPHRPAQRRAVSPCQLGAVHTWHCSLTWLHILRMSALWAETGIGARYLDVAYDPNQTSSSQIWLRSYESTS
jgi:hypothetical protein